MHAVSTITLFEVIWKEVANNQPINKSINDSIIYSTASHSLKLNVFIKAGYLQEKTLDLVYILHLYNVYYTTFEI